MSALFYIVAVFVVTLVTTVVSGYEFHEVASIVALGLSSVAAVISIINAADLNALFTAIKESVKIVKGDADERSGS